MAYNQYDLQNTSLVKTGILTEMYIPLWWYSSGQATVSGSGSAYIQKGTTSCISSSSGTNLKLHTLNSNWNSNQKFAFEVSVYSGNSSITCTVSLYDFTANSTVSGSTISTTATTSTLLRSGQFTLISGHAYGVVFSGLTSTTVGLSKASLIAFLS